MSPRSPHTALPCTPPWPPSTSAKRCNVHPQRELEACVEDGHLRAETIITALFAMKQVADQARVNGKKFADPTRRARLQKPDDDWVANGLKA
jgi:hypothetical protein